MTKTAPAKDPQHCYAVNACEVGMRLDRFICLKVGGLSREAARRLIQEGRARVLTPEAGTGSANSGDTHLSESDTALNYARELPTDAVIGASSDDEAKMGSATAALAITGPGVDVANNGARRLRENQYVEILLADKHQAVGDEAEAIALETVWLDDQVIVIDKPAGLVVHPGAGNPRHTLLNALLHWWPQQKNLERAGIIHRLDRDTSGLMVVARTAEAMRCLQKSFKAHAVKRHYLAIVHGNPIAGGTIDAPLSRHGLRRRQFDVSEHGRDAVTHFRVLRHLRDFAVISAQLQTGRTHQIRVHMRHIGYPVLGDPVYGGRRTLSTKLDPTLYRLLGQSRRQMLHSWKISFRHPTQAQQIALTSPLPMDMRSRLRALTRFNSID